MLPLIAPQPAHLAAAGEQHESRRVIGGEAGQVVRPGRRQIDPPQWRALALVALRIAGADLPMPGPAPGAILALQHHQLERLREGLSRSAQQANKNTQEMCNSE